MIVFKVVKEQHGWSVRMGQRMSTPFWSRDMAVWEANRLADGIRRHGELTEVIIEGGVTNAQTHRTRTVGTTDPGRVDPGDRKASPPTFA